MWAQYGPLGMLVEDRKLPSVGGSESSKDIDLPYVVNDITTFFTLLVGIYFPSVTGEGRNKAAGYRSNEQAFVSSLLYIRVSPLPSRHHGWLEPLR